MAILRTQLYGNQHFLLDLGTGNAGPEASFCEVTIPGIEIEMIEYRSGSDKESNVRKVPGLARYPDVTLRRGITGSLNLYEWINDVRNGAINTSRTVSIQLLSEDQTTVVLTWTLLRAWPVKWSGPDLDGKGNDVAMEEVVLGYDRLEVE